MTRFSFAIAAACLLGVATLSSAQITQVDPNQWKKGTALSLFAGGAVADPGVDVAAGGAIGWEITPHLTIEGSGLWVDGKASNAFTALLGARGNLWGRSRFVPFVSGGIGVENTSVDATRPDVPEFFRRRLTIVPGTGTQTFNDFVTAVGGGLDWFLNRHIAVQPDLRVLIVYADARTYPIAVYGVNVAYHFEEHPVTR